MFIVFHRRADKNVNFEIILISFLVKDISLCLKYNDKIKLHIYTLSLTQQYVFILMATSFCHNDRHQVSFSKKKT
jgi:hypothetical protein